ncbi:MAG TPA: DUF222 domain-containing protein [Acidimicrobiales bacterium]|nr:DUF222 domain-containing protein [Acidimicrobiales bacterium]
MQERPRAASNAEPVMAPLLALSADFRTALASFDPALVPGDTCAALVEELALVGKACDAAKARAAARAAACGAHKSRGHADAPGWLAAVSGTTTAEAKEAIEVNKALNDLPATAEALAKGEVSMRQAVEIAHTERENPGNEERLLNLAKQSGISPVRDEARRLRLAACNPEDLSRRQREARYFSHWVDNTGMIKFEGALPPVEGTAFVSRVERLAAQSRRKAADPEHFKAHAADALVSLVLGAPENQGHTPARSEVVFLCDLGAFRRGHAESDEPVRLLGGSPVPVGVINAALDDAFVKAILYYGSEINAVAHFGRHINEQLLTALKLGAPPTFEGAVCATPGCGRRFGLQKDHIVPVAAKGETSYANLQYLCYHCHSDKTERDRKAAKAPPPLELGPAEL